MKQIKTMLLTIAMLLVAPALFPSCQEDAPKINYTTSVSVVNDFTKVVDAINDGTLKNEQAIQKLADAIDKMNADQQTKLQALTDAITATGSSLDAKLTAVEAALKAQTLTVGSKLTLLETAIKALPDYSDKLDAIKAVIESLPDYGSKLDALEAAIKALPDYTAQLGAIKSAIAALPDYSDKITALENAIKALPDYSSKFDAVVSALGDMKTQLEALGTAQTTTAEKIAEVTTAVNALMTEVKAGNTAAATAMTKIVEILEAFKAALGGGGITPTVPVTGVTLDQATLSLTEGSTVTLVATVAPDDATDKSVTWASDDETIATVDNEGKVTAVAAGTATITVTTVDGAKTATCAVTVTAGGGATVAVTGVMLDQTTLELLGGSMAPLVATVQPADATNKDVTWSSDDEAVATVDNAGIVTALAAGTATITATTVDGAKTATCAVTITEAVVGEYVDLGLPSGTKWATKNLGATKPSDYGDYYAWGETTPKGEYTWDTYKWGPKDALTKYNDTDRKEILDPEDDAATATLGASWRMPNEDEILELERKCTWTWTTLSGVKGYRVKGPNGKSIFLPAAGTFDGSAPRHVGETLYYPSNSTVFGYACTIIMGYSANKYTTTSYRCDGLTIRPVRL